ncbi:pleckstrin homology domain-containing family F member 2 [Brachionus plicatilis]|uniref:Pleckstrin homology domain-containing family F member 2 n=1 Tax=Brachionus plicatilis TaxID=10195 RepID=A0A3M7QUF9_BRAPC|nr:pleckstrin homology domain-containing family F member 2 [Brachionus plicatilis]
MTLTFEERLTRLADTELNIERIKGIEKAFGSDNKKPLAIPGRALVGEGVLIKECRKKPKPRYFFLFNDVLVYATIVINKKKYINQHVIPLKDVQIKSINDSENPKLKNGWLIMSPKKTFCVYATTSKEKFEWMSHISNCIEKLSNNERKGFDQIKNIDIAPKWIPDKEADTCMRCEQVKFTMVNRRHHCRNCGYVICGDCSKNKFLIQSQSDEPLRVCNECYKILTSDRKIKSDNNFTSTDSSDESDAENDQFNPNSNDVNF